MCTRTPQQHKQRWKKTNTTTNENKKNTTTKNRSTSISFCKNASICFKNNNNFYILLQQHGYSVVNST
eukprot:m.282059 g.282059  ORF g.282059 m.282059 type:complete len:68 (+) comp119394_c0_seq1:100-303(+)